MQGGGFLLGHTVRDGAARKDDGLSSARILKMDAQAMIVR